MFGCVMLLHGEHELYGLGMRLDALHNLIKPHAKDVLCASNFGMTRHDVAWHGMAWPGMHRMVWHCTFHALILCVLCRFVNGRSHIQELWSTMSGEATILHTWYAIECFCSCAQGLGASRWMTSTHPWTFHQPSTGRARVSRRPCAT